MAVEINRRKPFFREAEQQALAQCLSGYRGSTREAYALELRQFVNWCSERDLRLLAVRRVEIGDWPLARRNRRSAASGSAPNAAPERRCLPAR